MATFDAFIIPNSPKEKASGKMTKLKETLTLAPFHPIPKIIFQDVKVGQKAHHDLEIVNPTGDDVQVELVSKVSLTDRNLELSSTNFEVAAGQSFNLQITWVPTNAGTLKTPVTLRTNSKFRTEFMILCVAVAPMKNSKKILGVQNGDKAVKLKRDVVPAPTVPQQRASERRKTFVLRGNKENLVTSKTAIPHAAAITTAPEPAPRRLASAATVAHPSRFENLVLSPFVSRPNRFEEVVLSPAVHGPWQQERTPPTSPTPLQGAVRRETYGVPAPPTFSVKLEDVEEESADCYREMDSLVSVFEPGICSTAVKKSAEFSLASSEEYVGVEEHLSAETYVLDRLSTETYIKEEPHEVESPVKEERKIYCKNLSGTIMEAISEECSHRLEATTLTVSPPKRVKKPMRASPTLVTRRKISVVPEIRIYTPPDNEGDTKKTKVGALPRIAMPRLTLSRTAPSSRQSVCLNSSRLKHSSRQPVSTSSSRKSVSAASSRQSLSSNNSSRISVCSSVQSTSSAGSSPRGSRTTSLAKARRQEKSEFLYDPDALISEMINNDLVAASTSADPFLTNTLFFDDSWKLKQEKDMIKWLNVLLTPPAELAADTDSAAVNIADVWQRCCRSEQVELAPTREDVSAEVYDAAGRLNALRKAAISFLAKSEIRQVLGKVAVHIDKKLLVIRDDKDLHLDTGLKYQVMELLLSYNPLWLRIGLEAIYGRTVSLASNSDVVGLAKFIVENVLTDKHIVATHSHPTVPHLRLPTYADAMKKFILKKFLFLVYFLDRAKSSKLIGHDPCLFIKSSKYKESREILLAFSSTFLSGVGDILRHLAVLGYHVSVKQRYIDEFEFAVTCLKDLRDGVRLVRVMEIVLKKDTLMAKLRVPAISMLQKVHNMEIALKALSDAGYSITGNITPKDLVNGHHEKTLSLLWQIIYRFQAPRLEEAARRIQAWWNNKKLYREIKNRIVARKRAVYAAAATRIQTAWRARLARKRVAHLRENKAAEMARREGAAIVIQKSWRMCVARKELIRARRASDRIKEWFFGAIITRKVRAEFLAKRQAAIKIQSVFRGYLTRKRLANLRRTAAALRIQTWFRRRKAARLLEAASALARWWVEEREREIHACVVIQVRFRAMRTMRETRERFLEKKSAAVVIQTWWRATMAMQRDRREFLRKKRAVRVIEERYRGLGAMRQERALFEVKKMSAVVIQRWYRSVKKMEEERSSFVRKRNAAIKIERYIRAYKLRQLRSKSAVVIQRKWRATLEMRAEKRAYASLQSAAVTLQVRWRAVVAMRKEKNSYDKLKHATIVVQRRWRAVQAGRETRKEYSSLRNAAVVLQRRWRAKVHMRQDRAAFLRIRSAAIAIQTRLKAILKRRDKERLEKAVICVQRRWRAKKLMERQRKEFLDLKSAVISVQQEYRRKLCRKSWLAVRTRKELAATKIQAVWRGYSARKRRCAASAEIHERCRNAAKAASKEKTLAFISDNAVCQLRQGNYNKAMEALVALSKITVLSRELCVTIAENGVVFDIYDFLSQLNRSEIHRQFLVAGTAILLNLTKCRETTDFVWQNGSRVFFYLHLMNVWLNKERDIFLNCATILWHFAQYPEFAQVLVDSQTSRMLNIFERKASKKRNLLAISTTERKLPSESPSWGLTLLHGRPSKFSDELFAIEVLMNVLHESGVELQPL